MTVLARFVSIFAPRLLRVSWGQLLLELESTYRDHLEAVDRQPTILAQQLLISGEDHRYYRHGGFDVIAICRAIWRGMILRQPEGASTIEMQLVRVLTGKYDKTLKRKIQEIALATLISKVIPKNDIPAVYLEIAYFGRRMNGFRAAFRKIGGGARQLTYLQTAQLVARLKYPEPRYVSSERLRKINVRADHLLSLYEQHRQGNTYQGMMKEVCNETV